MLKSAVCAVGDESTESTVSTVYTGVGVPELNNKNMQIYHVNIYH